MAHRIEILMLNDGGELARRSARDETHAKEILSEMIEALPYVNHGDSFVVRYVGSDRWK